VAQCARFDTLFGNRVAPLERSVAVVGRRRFSVRPPPSSMSKRRTASERLFEERGSLADVESTMTGSSGFSGERVIRSWGG
jgi:hypothetical protein